MRQSDNEGLLLPELPLVPLLWSFYCYCSNLLNTGPFQLFSWSVLDRPALLVMWSSTFSQPDPWWLPAPYPCSPSQMKCLKSGLVTTCLLPLKLDHTTHNCICMLSDLSHAMCLDFMLLSQRDNRTKEGKINGRICFSLGIRQKSSVILNPALYETMNS